MRINFIRHAETVGNLLKKYIGTTDENICREGSENLKKHTYPECGKLYVSPMKRCIQTAEIIYPNENYTVADGFRECDFGDFEGKNYIELEKNPEYQSWIDSMGKSDFPNGESPLKFRERVVHEFMNIIRENVNTPVITLVVHGGTIMAILEKFEENHGDYYSYRIENCGCLVTDFDGKKISILKKL